MNQVTAVITASHEPFFERVISRLSSFPAIEKIVVVSDQPDHSWTCSKPHQTMYGQFMAGKTLAETIAYGGNTHLLFILSMKDFTFEPAGLDILLDGLHSPGIGAVYGDYFESTSSKKTVHPLCDYQKGSVREDFDFGPVILFASSAIHNVASSSGLSRDTHFGALYDLRLKVSMHHTIMHIQKPLSSVEQFSTPFSGDSLFAYVDTKNRQAQIEYEEVFTDYLRATGAYIPPDTLASVDYSDMAFPTEASVIIPVKNRKNTIIDAITSATRQITDFPFNVLVVDNHSTDGTTEIIAPNTKTHPSLYHLIPPQHDLAIGGCWELALKSPWCGRFAIQLDSDDIYHGTNVLQRVVDTFKTTNAAMVIGSYSLVDFQLNEIPPGLIDHREWTDENGHNNGLRVNGFGAPRAFYTPIARTAGFPNVSYGEDYAVTLRICRKYRVARIFESLYLCRRWSGNTDALLSTEAANQNDTYKDGLRTKEIKERQQMNTEGI